MVPLMGLASMTGLGSHPKGRIAHAFLVVLAMIVATVLLVISLNVGWADALGRWLWERSNA